MSPSEIAFLALGLVLGAAIGAAIMEAVRSRPAPRREVRLTIAPNSTLPRRGATLAGATAGGPAIPIPGSPEDGAWPDRRPAPGPAGGAPGRSGATGGQPARTRVPSGRLEVTAAARAVPIGAAPIAGPGAGTAHHTGGRPGARAGGTDAATGTHRVPPSGAVALLDPVAPPHPAERPASVAPAERTAAPQAAPLPAVVDVGAVRPDLAVRARPPAPPAPVGISPVAVAIAIEAGGARAASGDGGEASTGRRRSPGGASTPTPGNRVGDPAADPCGGPRQLVEERCAVASAAREQAHAVADALRAAQRAYDELRERVERAQADADPRAIAAAKDSLHKQFRVATATPIGAEDTEAAAREWLTRINELNTRSRDALRVVESGSAELRAAVPRLDRMSVEADAARIGAETAEAACREARERLAACEEDRAAARLVAAPPADRGVPPEPVAPQPGGWPDEPSTPLATPALTAHQAALVGLPAIVRILRGDRNAREQLVAAAAEGDPEAARTWHLRLAALFDAIAARAIEDGYLDLPDDDPFWGLFSAHESREIVGALSALGFRFDGLGGFADDRVPVPRDLSLAVGYAGLDRMRIRNWPREGELAGLYARATVAADEWLAHEAGDLSLGEMVDALGSRAGDLADVWNAWGRLRPLLLAPD